MQAEYSVLSNNCEHLVTIATLGFPLSIQVNEFIYQALRTTKRSAKAVRISARHHVHETSLHSLCDHTRLNGHHTTHGPCDLQCHPANSVPEYHLAHPHQLLAHHSSLPISPNLSPNSTVAGSGGSTIHTSAAGAAKGGTCITKGGLKYAAKSTLKSTAKTTTKTTTKAIPKVATKSASKAIVKAGAKATAGGGIIGAIAGVALAVNLLIEGPLCVRNVYKLHRKRAFELISEQEYKRSRSAAIITSANAVAGGTTGAILGQAIIPVPVFGAATGGFIGSIAGQGCGHLEGVLWSRFIHQDQSDITLPEVEITKYSDVDKLKYALTVHFSKSNETIQL